MSRQLAFSKYHGAGNDFVMVFDPDDAEPLDATTVADLCDRRFGIGADGLIRVVRTGDDDARWFMDYRNADGSDAEMCGNGVRCVGAMLHDVGAESAETFAVRTRAGVKQLTLERLEGSGYRVTVVMGVPNFTKAAIPMRGPAWETFLGQPFDLGGGITVTASALSMGNPHLVLFVDEDPDRFHVGHIGSAIQRDERFPEGVNVEFVSVGGDDVIDARVWERGSGETMACGSGACAIAVAANEAGLADARVTVRFPGGDLAVTRTSSGQVELTGDAVHVFDGSVEPERLDVPAPAS
ncbi:MAG TPA: diaminopimelate epimerase [Actinomycetota bacterium]|nr:diaminopimelate epimerase [Actinomycetota bacterium]